MNPFATTIATIAIIALSAFFVAAEFSLINARTHRLEDNPSASARAALRSSGEITMLLAASQLGITVCTLALGAITKPAVHHALMRPLEMVGLGETAADVAAFVLALIIVTFLHLVIGEMAPKSWAIAHPEKSAIMLALPMRAFMRVTRPILAALNRAANWLVRRSGVEPVDEVSQSQDSTSLRQLVEHSASVGALDLAYRTSLTSAIDLERLTIADLLDGRGAPTAAPATATVGDVQAAVMRKGHTRVLLMEPTGACSGVRGVVHVRDTLMLPAATPADTVARPVLELPRDTALLEALRLMREGSHQLAVVTDNGAFSGVVTLGDILPKLLPRADAVTDGAA